MPQIVRFNGDTGGGRRMGIVTQKYQLVAVTASILAAVAAGQPAHGQSSKSTTSGGLQEIIVTAERRSENLQTTPIAMSALSGNDIAQQGVRDQTYLQFATPALSMTQVGFTENVNIRGIGINLQSPVVVSGVALYRDGLFYPGNIMADEPYYDVKDVEVLRGPQGTFVGQNSTGRRAVDHQQQPELRRRSRKFRDANG